MYQGKKKYHNPIIENYRGVPIALYPRIQIRVSQKEMEFIIDLRHSKSFSVRDAIEFGHILCPESSLSDNSKQNDRSAYIYNGHLIREYPSAKINVSQIEMKRFIDLKLDRGLSAREAIQEGSIMCPCSKEIKKSVYAKGY